MLKISKDRPEALSLGISLYYGNECKHCKTTVKRVKKYDCLECHKESVRRHIKETPQGRATKSKHKRLRKAGVIQAMPSWADSKAIGEIYLQAQKLGLHVDHIVPLKGKLVCGLHVEYNLQLMDPLENILKGNHWDV